MHGRLARDDRALLGAVAAVCIVALVGVLGTATYLYATDHELTADVTATRCGGLGVPDIENVVSIRTRFVAIDHDVTGIPDRECLLLGEGDYVEYHVRSKHTTLYRSNGACVYDSETGTACGRLSVL